MTEISRVGALNAAAAGGVAFRAGLDVTDVPHRGPDAGDRFLAHYWMRGWRSAKEHAESLNND